MSSKYEKIAKCALDSCEKSGDYTLVWSLIAHWSDEDIPLPVSMLEFFGDLASRLIGLKDQEGDLRTLIKNEVGLNRSALSRLNRRQRNLEMIWRVNDLYTKRDNDSTIDDCIRIAAGQYEMEFNYAHKVYYEWHPKIIQGLKGEYLFKRK